MFIVRIIMNPMSSSSFMLVMQTGAFLQLILTLVAIASRLDMLLIEIESALEVSLAACFRLLDVLDSAAARKMQHLTPSGTQKPLQPIQAIQAVVPAANTTQAVAPAVHDEDIGSTLERLDTIQQEDGPSKSTMRANSPLRMEDDVVELSADVFNMNTSSSTRVSFIVYVLPERFSSICCSNGSPE